MTMYEDLDSFERALMHFGTRVDVICAMEMGHKVDSETAYQLIKQELKALKKVRKTERKNISPGKDKDWRDFWRSPSTPKNLLLEE